MRAATPVNMFNEEVLRSSNSPSNKQRLVHKVEAKRQRLHSLRLYSLRPNTVVVSKERMSCLQVSKARYQPPQTILEVCRDLSVR